MTSACSSAKELLVTILLVAFLAGTLELRAQQRVFARVDPNRDAITSSADVYDPSGAASRSAGFALEARSLHTATLLSAGTVLVVGGYNGNFLSSAEIYDPATGAFRATTTGMSAARRAHTATLLADGRVLIAGGYNGTHLNTAELYDPSTDGFTATQGKLVTTRSSHTATLLGDRVVVAGGYNG